MRRLLFLVSAVLRILAVAEVDQAGAFGVGKGVYRFDVLSNSLGNEYCGCNDYLGSIPIELGPEFCGPNNECDAEGNFVFDDHPEGLCVDCDALCLNTIDCTSGDGRYLWFSSDFPDQLDQAISVINYFQHEIRCDFYGPVYGPIFKLFSFEIPIPFHWLLPIRGWGEVIGYGSEFWALASESHDYGNAWVSYRSWVLRRGTAAKMIYYRGGWENAEPWLQTLFAISDYVIHDLFEPTGHPPTYVGYEWDDPPEWLMIEAREIEYYTCQIPAMGDCYMTPAERSTWGTVKAIFR